MQTKKLAITGAAALCALAWWPPAHAGAASVTITVMGTSDIHSNGLNCRLAKVSSLVNQIRAERRGGPHAADRLRHRQGHRRPG